MWKKLTFNWKIWNAKHGSVLTGHLKLAKRTEAYILNASKKISISTKCFFKTCVRIQSCKRFLWQCFIRFI